jgi:hypothetical protein
MKASNSPWRSRLNIARQKPITSIPFNQWWLHNGTDNASEWGKVLIRFVNESMNRGKLITRISHIFLLMGEEDFLL